ncbi:hypothetical protein MASR1M45_17630 [Candidatus Kapaibacterium sp.]
MDGYILNAFFTLAVVVAAFGALLFILKKTQLSKKSKDSDIEMKIISKMALNQKNQLYIVQIADKKLLLGVSDSGIRNLSQLSFANNTDIPQNVSTLSTSKNVNDYEDDSLSFKSFVKSTFKIRAN